MELIPRPLDARHGLERAAFAFLVLGAGAVPGPAVANACFGLALASAVAWRVAALRRGEDLLGPFRRRTPLHGPIGLFVLLTVCSGFFSTHVPWSLYHFKGLGTFLLVPLVAGLVRDADDADVVLDAVRLTALYLMLRGFSEGLAGADNVLERPTGGTSVYMTYAGLLMVFGLLLAARGLTGRGRGRLDRAADLAVASFAVVAVGLSFTRNAYLGLAAGALALAACWRPRTLLAVPVLAAAFYVAMPADVRERVRTSVGLHDETSRDRIAMWKAGALMVADRPLFGVGPGRIRQVYPVYRQPGHFSPWVGHLHSNVVNIAAETGIPSALVYLAFVAAVLVRAWPIARSEAAESPLARGAIAATAALFVAGLFEYNFGDVEVLMATLVLTTLPFAARRRDAEAGAVPGR